MRVGALKEGRLETCGRREPAALDDRRGDKAFTVDLRESNLLPFAESHRGVRNRNQAISFDSAGHHRGDDSLRVRIDDDVFHMPGLLPVGSSNHVFVLANLED